MGSGEQAGHPGNWIEVVRLLVSAWDGNGAVRLQAAHKGESAYALLIERCMPGTPLGQTLPESEQDLVVTRLLRQLWAQPPAGYPFRPLSEMCAAWAEEFEQEYAAASAADKIDPGLARAGIALFRVWVPRTCAAWADALQIVVGSVRRPGAGRAGLGPSGDAMIFGLWA